MSWLMNLLPKIESPFDIKQFLMLFWILYIELHIRIIQIPYGHHIVCQGELNTLIYWHWLAFANDKEKACAN